MPMAQPMPVERIAVGYMPAATAMRPVPVPPTKKPARNEAVPSVTTDDVAWPNQARHKPPMMNPGMRTRNAPPRCTSQPDIALAQTLPRLFKPTIKAAPDSEKRPERATDADAQVI